MDHLDNVKSTNSNKKWVDIDIRGRSLHTLERKETAAKFRIFSGHDSLAIISREWISLTRTSMFYVIKIPSWTQNIYSSAVHSIEKDKLQRIPPASTQKHEEKWCKIQNSSN